MKVLAIVAEYNPFHTGHKYQIEKSKELLKTDYVLAIMSPSFVQRGEPSIFDKWTRAKLALDNGVDLVIELPSLYSLQTAEIFSRGAMKILNATNSIDYLSFGMENKDLSQLKIIAKLLAEEPKEYRMELRKNLDLKLSYPVARQKAIEGYLEKSQGIRIQNILDQSNNILAIEYLKSLYLLNSPIEAIGIERQESHYKDQKLGEKYSSATSLRKKLLDDQFTGLTDFIPRVSSQELRDLEKNSLENYYQLFRYRLILAQGLDQIFDLDQDLINRIYKNKQAGDLDSFLEANVSKNYTRARLQRAIINSLLNIKEKDFRSFDSNYRGHIRILASNEKGFDIIKKIKKNSSIPIINKFSDHRKYRDLDYIMKVEKKATDLYFLSSQRVQESIGLDYKISPYIKK